MLMFTVMHSSVVHKFVSDLLKDAGRFLRQMAILTLVYMGGEATVRLTTVALPGSVAGMLIMLLLLATGAVPLHWVEGAANLLLQRLSLFFLPALVGLANYWSLISGMLAQLVLVVVISTVVVMLGAAGMAVMIGRAMPHARP